MFIVVWAKSQNVMTARTMPSSAESLPWNVFRWAVECVVMHPS